MSHIFLRLCAALVACYVLGIVLMWILVLAEVL